MLFSGVFNRVLASKHRRADIEPDSDKALNFSRDQKGTINRELRQLNRERGLDMAMTSTALILLGSGLGLVMMRRYRLASFVGLGFLLEQLLEYRRVKTIDPNEIELERRALQLERGDYGKLEVIPFR